MTYALLMAEAVKFLLRLDRGLHAKLAELAQREHRSLHSQILVILERAVADP